MSAAIKPSRSMLSAMQYIAMRPRLGWPPVIGESKSYRNRQLQAYGRVPICGSNSQSSEAADKAVQVARLPKVEKARYLEEC